MKRGSVSIGPLSANSAGIRHHIPQRVELDAPDRVTNAMSREPLDLRALWAGSALRPGCQQFLQYRSVGTGC